MPPKKTAKKPAASASAESKGKSIVKLTQHCIAKDTAGKAAVAAKKPAAKAAAKKAPVETA